MKMYLLKWNEAKIKFKEWWGNLGTRDKFAATIGSLCLGLFLFYALIGHPILTHLQSMRESLIGQKKLLVWMDNANAEIKKSGTASKTTSEMVSPVVLLSQLQKEINDVHLSKNVKQLKQINNDSISLHLQKVQFDEVIAMLMRVVKLTNVSILQMHVVAENNQGLVSLDTTLQIGTG